MGDVRLRVVSGQQTPISAYSTELADVEGTVEVIPKTADAFVVVRVSDKHWPLRASKAQPIVEATGLTVLVIPHGMEFELVTIDNEPEQKVSEDDVQRAFDIQDDPG